MSLPAWGSATPFCSHSWEGEVLRFGLCSRSRFLVSSQKQQNDCEERKQNLIFCRPSRSVKSRNHTIELDSLCLCFSAYMIFFFLSSWYSGFWAGEESAAPRHSLVSSWATRAEGHHDLVKYLCFLYLPREGYPCPQCLSSGPRNLSLLVVLDNLPEVFNSFFSDVFST